MKDIDTLILRKDSSSVTIRNENELIHCKDCKHYAIAKNGVNGFCNKLAVPFDANEWCSRAEVNNERIRR